MRTLITLSPMLLAPTKVLAALLVFFSLAGPALAAGTVDENRAVDADGWIRFRGVEGDLRVEPGADDRWQLSGDLADSVESVNISGDASAWTIELKYRQSGNRWNFNVFDGGSSTDLTLRVPATARVDVEVVSANITVGELRGKQLEFTSVSGDIISAATPEFLEAESVSGDIQLSAAGSKESKLESVSGDIRINSGGGYLDASSVSGDITLRSATLQRASLKAVSGDLTLDVDLNRDSKLSLESHSGDIALTVPSHHELDLEVETFSGRIRSDWGNVKTNKHGPGSSLRHHPNNPTAKVDINAFSGDVKIRGQ